MNKYHVLLGGNYSAYEVIEILGDNISFPSVQSHHIIGYLGYKVFYALY